MVSFISYNKITRGIESIPVAVSQTWAPKLTTISSVDVMPIFESGVMRSRVLLFEFFLVQVMNSYCLFAKPTSHRALLVLPGPRRFCSIVSDCSHMLLSLVLLAGDVESNPGPDKEILKVLNELQSGQTVMLAQLKSIEKLKKNWLIMIKLSVKLKHGSTKPRHLVLVSTTCRLNLLKWMRYVPKIRHR